jgi:hypothetical protein
MLAARALEIADAVITAAVSDRAGISDLVKGEVFFGSPPASAD